MFWRRVRQPVAAALAAILLSLSPLTRAVADPDIGSSLAMLRLSSPGPMAVRGQAVDRDALNEFYAGRDYALAWNDTGVGLGPRAAVILSVLSAADEEGLDPADYHVREIAALAAATGSGRIDRDLLLSDGLLRYASDVRTGRLTARNTSERFSAKPSFDAAGDMAVAPRLDPATLADLLTDLPPAGGEYRALRAMLAALRPVAEAGGWQALPEGDAIHPGERSPAISALRLRLAVEGRIAADPGPKARANADLYDPRLKAAVTAFQGQHGLRPDGVIGMDTRAALDMPADARVRQAIVNLERFRWGDPIPASGRFVAVNLAAFSLTVYQDGAPTLAMPVVVGTRENPTPILDSRITAVILNPTWTLPPVVIKEMLPRLREDASYLADRGIERKDHDGRIRLVQPSGPTNPLGRYKFIMPNDQDIYLHDSPAVAKFRFAVRAYSHGCVRLSDAAALAALLLDDKVISLPGGLAELVENGATHRISLANPVPVSLIYRTAWLNPAGGLVLGDDIYGRDPVLWTALRKSSVGPARKLAATRASAGAL